jgi:hypothetical protein
MGIRALYGRKIARCDALKFGNPGNPTQVMPGSAQPSDLLVDLCQRLLQDRSIARVFRGVELF